MYSNSAGDPKQYNLSDKFMKICRSAEDVLLKIRSSVESGDITLMELLILKENGSHVDELFQIIFSDTNKKIIMQNLSQRYHEQRLFASKLSCLRRVCDNISIPIEGMFLVYISDVVLPTIMCQ